jgi:hypothetical protein
MPMTWRTCAVPLSRFDRDYELAVSVGGGREVIVTPPMRISFSATKSVSGGLNKMTCRIYNLQPSNRLALTKDAGGREVIPVSLRVGYRGAMALIFKGTIYRGLNFREGPDSVTELESQDGGAQVLGTFISTTVRGKDRAIDAVRQASGLGKGKVTEQSPLIRPRVLVGPTARVLDDLLEEGATWYVDDEQLYVLKSNEVVSSFVPVVNAATGLLNTPTREQSKVTFETLMNPTLRIGNLCKLESQSASHMNGLYRIIEMGYSGDNYGSGWSMSITALPSGDYTVL